MLVQRDILSKRERYLKKQKRPEGALLRTAVGERGHGLRLVCRQLRPHLRNHLRVLRRHVVLLQLVHGKVEEPKIFQIGGLGGRAVAKVSGGE